MIDQREDANGERVAFGTQYREPIKAVITRYKTVTVITEDGRRWNVSPGLPLKDAIDIVPHSQPAAAGAKVAALKIREK